MSQSALAVLALAAAGIGPSFDEDGCAWDATHVVVVTEGAAIDGAVEVLESWKGDLKRGDRLTVPELARFARRKARAVGKLDDGGDDDRPARVTGARMALFLIRARPGAPGTPVWRPANLAWGKMEVSVAWFERGKAYAVFQQFNPAPSEILSLQMTEAQLKGRVARVTGFQAYLARTAATADPAALAAALLRAARFESHHVPRAAIRSAAGAGPRVLPGLRAVLTDESLRESHPDALRALAEAGGAATGPELTAALERELAAWRKVGPGLKQGWWNGSEGLPWAETERLRNRYSVTLAALEALREVRFPGCRKAVAELQELWRMNPQLRVGSPDEVNGECSRLLFELP
jgi:hypothetical protein